MAQVEEEVRGLQEERGKVAKLRAQLETAAARLELERIALDKRRVRAMRVGQVLKGGIGRLSSRSGT